MSAWVSWGLIFLIGAALFIAFWACDRKHSSTDDLFRKNDGSGWPGDEA